MGFDPVMFALTNNSISQNLEQLSKNGQIGSDTKASSLVLNRVDEVFSPNEELGGLTAKLYYLDLPKYISSLALVLHGDSGSTVYTIEPDGKYVESWDDDAIYWGNTAALGGDTSMPGFPAMVIDRVQGAMIFYWPEDSASNKLSFHLQAEYLRPSPIDPKFLPGAVLPVVELSTTLKIGATFTDAENEALNRAFSAGTPVVLRCDSIETPDSRTFTDCKLMVYSTTSGGLRAFTTAVLDVQIALTSSGGGAWVCGM